MDILSYDAGRGVSAPPELRAKLGEPQDAAGGTLREILRGDNGIWLIL